jgi:hypothetical protein
VFSGKMLAQHGCSLEQSGWLYPKMEGALQECSFKHVGSKLATPEEDAE